MANLFGDQLVKAGLVKKDQLNKAKKSKHRQKKADRNVEFVNEAAEAARQAAAEKVARDLELNLRHKEELERKAIQAQIRQLVEMNRLPREDGDIGYNFQDGSLVRKIFVSSEVHAILGRGALAIVRYDGGYEVIPSVVAEKIRLRDPSCIVSQTAVQEESNAEDDPYADYKVPDDLMW